MIKFYQSFLFQLFLFPFQILWIAQLRPVASKASISIAEQIFIESLTISKLFE